MLLLYYFGLQQNSKTHYRSPFIHEVDALSALSYLLQCVCACTFIVFQRANALIRLWFGKPWATQTQVWRNDEGQNPFLHMLKKSQAFPHRCLWVSYTHFVSWAMSQPVFTCHPEKWSVAMGLCVAKIFVFYSFCILSDFSISVFPAPLWSGTHFCFVSLNIPFIVTLTEVKPLLISFVYIVEDGDRGSMGETACWKGEEAIIMIVLFGSTRAPLVWEEEKDVLCFVYERVAKAAMGNL